MTRKGFDEGVDGAAKLEVAAETDGEVVEASDLASSIKDGLLDITVVHNGSLIENAISAVDLLSGMIGKSAFSTTFRASDIRIIRNHAGPAHFDGEPAKLDKIIDVHCHPGALRLFATGRKNRLRPIMSPEIPFLSPLALTIRDLRHKLYNKVLGSR